jgi:hypothetical protein
MHSESGGADRSGTQGSGANQEVVRIELPKTVPLSDDHRVVDFRCAKNPRIQGFFVEHWPELQKLNYCRVFVFPNPDDLAEIWGYYTLSSSALARGSATKQEQKRIPPGIPVPAVLIGFMGRADHAPRGLGESLIVDAARRACRNEDIPAFGLMLNSDGGPDNPKLWEWYQAQGFIPALDDPNSKRPSKDVMYAPFKRLIPELGATKPYPIKAAK